MPPISLTLVPAGSELIKQALLVLMNSTNRDMIRHKNSKNQLRLEGKSGDNEAKASAAQWFGLVRLRRAGGLCKDQPGAYLPWGRQQGRLKQRRPWKGELQRHVSHVFAIVDLADCLTLMHVWSLSCRRRASLPPTS